MATSEVILFQFSVPSYCIEIQIPFEILWLGTITLHYFVSSVKVQSCFRKVMTAENTAFKVVDGAFGSLNQTRALEEFSAIWQCF
jgi:hypothetical protein